MSAAFSAAVASAQRNSSLQVGGNFALCTDGLSPGTCAFSQATVKLSLERLKPKLSEWRFEIIDFTRWTELCKEMKLRDCPPAFSVLEQHTTYIISTLTTFDSRVDEYLQRYTDLKGQARLDWVLSHELGHILCRSAKESTAETAGGRLRYSDRRDGGCKILNQSSKRSPLTRDGNRFNAFRHANGSLMNRFGAPPRLQHQSVSDFRFHLPAVVRARQ